MLSIFKYLLVFAAYLCALEPRLFPAQPGRDRWGERHKAPCPASPNSLLLLFFSCFPSHFAWRTGSLTPSPPPSVALSLLLLSHNSFFLTSADVYSFSPSSACLSRSALCVLAWPSELLQRWWIHAWKQLTNSWFAERGLVFSLCSSLAPVSLFSASLNNSLFPYIFCLYCQLSLLFVPLFLFQPEPGEHFSKEKIFMYFYIFPSFIQTKKRAGIGRSMSPPCGTMLNQNKCDSQTVNVSRQASSVVCLKGYYTD